MNHNHSTVLALCCLYLLISLVVFRRVVFHKRREYAEQLTKRCFTKSLLECDNISSLEQCTLESQIHVLSGASWEYENADCFVSVRGDVFNIDSFNCLISFIGNFEISLYIPVNTSQWLVMFYCRMCL